MRHDDKPHSVTNHEPRFDLPPGFSGLERRMARRATSAWAARGGGMKLLPLAAIDLSYDADFAANSLLIDLRHGDELRVLSVGAALAETFRLSPGEMLDDAPYSLGAKLSAGCARLRQTLSEAPFEAALRTADIACLLTRGVLMPIADDHGKLGYAHGVVSWKQFIDAKTSATLREELREVLREPSDAGRKYRKPD